MKYIKVLILTTTIITYSFMHAMPPANFPTVEEIKALQPRANRISNYFKSDFSNIERLNYLNLFKYEPEEFLNLISDILNEMPMQANNNPMPDMGAVIICLLVARNLHTQLTQVYGKNLNNFQSWVDSLKYTCCRCTSRPKKS